MVKRKASGKRKAEKMPAPISGNVCRTCLSPKKSKRQKVVSLFSKLGNSLVANIITDCTGVEITQDDSLPAEICTECFETVKLLDAFMRTTRDSDSKLRCKVEDVDTEEDEPPKSADVSGNDLLEDIKLDPAEIIDKTEIVEDEENIEVLVQVEEEEAEMEQEDFQDSGSDWKGSGDEAERVLKRKKVGLKSKPNPGALPGKPTPAKRKNAKSAKSPPKRKYAQSEEDLELTEQEHDMFKVILIHRSHHVCCGCLKVFLSTEELDQHRRTTHIWKNENLMKPSSKILCDGCLRRYDSPRSLKLHLDKIRLLKVVWECRQCGHRFKAADKRRKHVRIHTEDAPIAMLARIKQSTIKEFGWLCCATKCGLSFPSEQELIEHSESAHTIDKQEADLEQKTKPAQCQICFRRFEDRQRVVSHQRRMYKKKNLQCALCGLKFANSVELNTHEMKQHGSSGFQCKICGKTFTQKYSMINHVKYMHTEEKQHQCTVCGMTFRLKGGLKTHMSNHVEIPQFKCEVCSKMFKAKLHLRYHMRTHTGEKPYKCRYCDHAFANNTNFRRHEMTHTGNKPHKCALCEKSFILRRTLLEHERTHSNENARVRVKLAQRDAAESSMVIEQVEYESVDDGDQEGEGSSYYEDDEEEEQEEAEGTKDDEHVVSFSNRPVQVKVISPQILPQPVRIVRTVPQVVENVLPTVSSSGAQTVVYNVVPSTSSGGNYSYILKFK